MSGLQLSVVNPPNSFFSLFGARGERDPSSILVELDRSTRSSKSGDQCEAIVFFGRLISNYPWPVIINTTALKLADLFRNSNNFVRYCIYLIFKHCESQLNKILNVDEVLRRIHSVLQSNDPIARAITLRTLCSIPALISDRLSIHHSIRNCFESTNELERQATVFAMDAVCLRSSTFAKGMLEHLAPLISSLTVSRITKLKLIRIFRTMHHDTVMAMKARTVCQDLLSVYPTRGFVLTILDTLTSLARRSLLDVPLQVQLLFAYLHKDPRIRIKLLCLRNLVSLVDVSSSFESFDVKELVLVLQHSPYISVQRGVLTLLRRLCARTILSPSAIPDTREICTSFLSNFLLAKGSTPQGPDQLTCAALAASVLTSLALSTEGEEKSDGGAGTTNTLLYQLLSVAGGCTVSVTDATARSSSRKPFRLLLRCISTLIGRNATPPGTAVDFVISLLPRANLVNAELLCECLLTCIEQHPEGLFGHFPELCNLMRSYLLVHPVPINILCALFRVCFRAYSTVEERYDELVAGVEPVITELLHRDHNWLCFTIARHSLCYGYHGLSLQIFRVLCERVESEYFYFWLRALELLSHAEQTSGFAKQRTVTGGKLSHALPAVLASYHDAVSCLKAAITPKSPLAFQLAYVQLRISFIETLNHLLALLPHAPHNVMAESAFKHMGTLRSVEQGYVQLSRSYFDIDTKSLQILEIYQVCCSVLSFALSLLLVGQKRHFNCAFPTKNSLYGQHLLAACRDIISHLPQSIDILREDERRGIVAGFIDRLLSVPAVYPPYFFHCKPTISIKLTTWPQTTPSAGEGITISLNAGLLLKISGLIVYSTPKRKALKHVQLTVRTSTVKTTGVDVQDGTQSVLTLNVVPHDDSFTTSCLLDFPTTGLYTISVQHTIVDCDNEAWHDPAQAQRPFIARII